MGVMLVAWCPIGVAKVVPRTTSSHGLPIPRFTKGIVDGRTYKNTSVGLEITAPPTFEFGSPELKGSPGTVNELVTVGAWGEQPGSPVRNGVTFYAEPLAYFPPDQRSTERYTQKVVQANRQQGFEIVGNTLRVEWGGTSFSRVDFWKWPAYEAVFVKSCTAQALVFIFSSSSLKYVNKLIAGSKLKLSTDRSHCSSNDTPK